MNNKPIGAENDKNAPYNQKSESEKYDYCPICDEELMLVSQRRYEGFTINLYKCPEHDFYETQVHKGNNRFNTLTNHQLSKLFWS